MPCPLSPAILLFFALCAADPVPIPHPLPEPGPDANAAAGAVPQSYTNNAPFSGAIYIVNSDGQGVTTQATNMCPDYASLSCGSMGQPAWCCPSSYTCASPPNSGGIIGCCPDGSSCGGSVNVASVTTVTVYAQQQTSVVYVQPHPTTVQVLGGPTTEVVYQGGFCSTLTMNGPGLPRATEGSCGTILIVNEAATDLRAFGYGVGAFILVFHLAMGRIFALAHRL
ncbi:hypothetical protein EJ04DRAFT_136127 [Polyplosphaeria fusca]|uniref:Uncharacterized protein n=1 Tax=Polyplosphaeria fusca TaxID=682080 RepID=A0A9P4V3V9_9PLEO|nr:hypothetical protein EJ04DRAFT_136127 [Polyplosphaeria fusca]